MDSIEQDEKELKNYQTPLEFKVIDKYKVLLGGWLEVSVNLGDITEENVDAITNAANEDLYHGGGVAGAIAEKGGPSIQIESDEWKKRNGLIKEGTAPAVTRSGNIKCYKYIIHAGQRDDEQLLYDCIKDTCRTACNYNLKSVSIPAISSGIFGFPRELCAAHLFRAVEDFCFENRPEILVDSIPTLRFVRFTDNDFPTVQEFQKKSYGQLDFPINDEMINEVKSHKKEIQDQETQTMSYDEVEMIIEKQIRVKIKNELAARDQNVQNSNQSQNPTFTQYYQPSVNGQQYSRYFHGNDLD
ncbi:UNKNOWN [Stylonychia lemnae]|uniref:Macro domain-containing protein n=1 Tax=Stylonychia lemnae TaxID=5949 RepID=A0A078A183_STYLE|nr:UNKNOWN [Stylonychia lemnae]|eukprot:CDW76016.1 UNKNOWN [Stylonychia lemnae]